MQKKTILSSTLSYFFPLHCVLCRKLELYPDFPFCKMCLKQLEEVGDLVCPRCGDPNPSHFSKSHTCNDCLNSELPFEKCCSVFSLKKPFADLLYLFKFKNSELCLDFFAEKMTQKLSEFVPVDFLIPVPSHWWRLLRRTYNPSLILAKAISKKTKIPLEFSSLKRVQLGSAQKTLNREQRLKNIRHVFKLSKQHPFQNKKVLLIDDVYTTGATLIECAKLLKKAGAEVYGLTLARTLLEFK